MTRRQLLCKMGNGFGSLALAQAAASASLTLNPLAPRPTHFPAKAKRVVYLYLNGGPSQVDTFDPKPVLSKFDSKGVPDSLKLDHAKGVLLGSPLFVCHPSVLLPSNSKIQPAFFSSGLSV